MSFTHLDKNNNPTMVDVGHKDITERIAEAICHIQLPNEIATQINTSGELITKKGAVFQTAIIAGTMAVKNTSQLIPFCHPLAIESIKININQITPNVFEISSQVKVTGKTGVEMEALTGATVCALTIYDMCKAISHEMVIKDTYLKNKSGGKRNIEDGLLCD